MPEAKSEAAPLKAGGDEPKGEAWYMRYGTALALTFYVMIAVTKTLLTKSLLMGAPMPIALSAMSCIVTCVMLIPFFLLNPSSFDIPRFLWTDRDKALGFALVTVLVALDMGFTNIAVSMLSVSIQQTILAVNPAFTVTIESIVKRSLKHPVIYATIGILLFGPIITQIGQPVTKSVVTGIIAQLAGCVCSACKYVFGESVQKACKKDLGAFAFLFWLDAATLIIFIPWCLINGEMVTLFSSIHDGVDFLKVFTNSFLGGMRFFSQLLVLRVSTATNLSCANIAFQAINIYLSIPVLPSQAPEITAFLVCGTLLTLTTSGVYTYWKLSKVLEKAPMCIKLNTAFVETVTCSGKSSAEENAPYTKA